MHPIEPRRASGGSKVPHVTLAFWVIKLLATTVGETGGDALSMSLGLGYAVASLIYVAFFAVTLTVQVASPRHRPLAYWAVVIATTTVGTTLSDYLDRTVGLGYVKSSIVLFFAVIVVLLVWRRVCGRVLFEGITDRRDEIFYWVTILVSNTLGTALGDFVADDAGLGFAGGTLLFGGLLALVAAGSVRVKTIPTAAYFWAAYVLSRPFGATLGDLLTKPHDEGGLALSRIAASLVILAAMLLGILAVALRERRTVQKARP
ncbi:MAG TPA: hypothetical protein VKZ18_02740 [Polyangia bacterium]|nr:hypothetical protein [Polyangia bacterium]